MENPTATPLTSTAAAPFPINSTSRAPSISILDIIAANDITSRANYFYAFIAGLGLVAACFLFYSFAVSYRAQRWLAWLDSLLWAFCGFQLLLLFLSLSAVAHRPSYLITTALGCVMLSFTVNVALLCGLFILVLVDYVLTFDPPSHALLRKPGVCAALVSLASVVSSLLLASFRGPRHDLGTMGPCFIDPVRAGLLYAAAKFILAFLTPYLLQVGLLIASCVRQWKSNGCFLSGSEEGPMFLTVTGVMCVCHLFYSVALVRGAHLEKDGALSPREGAFLSVAEFVFFSGSSVSLVLVLLMHRTCRDNLFGMFRQLKDCCQRSGRTQTNRNIIAPQIEITDTLQDYEL
ncbi:uncharacterized protein LOC117530978 [Thalassophryne amazonica]|uniref:uncharacterized protein LOC117530978 n=1 Tax=Thalassophryne amazonica TaxID=390379 RepID=UPI00147269CB|nr:uncharacterized protein LOC117530978 [Thalassophryne amazonica]